MKNNNNKVKLAILAVIAPLGLVINNYAYSHGLLKVYKLAAKKDPVLQQAFADFKSVEQNVPIAVADLLPEVTLNAGMSYDKVLNFSTTTQKNPEVNSKYFSVNLTQPLFYWDRISRYLQSEIEVEKAIHDLEAAKEDLLTRVSDAYFNVLEAQDTLEFITTEKRAVKQLYDESKERFDVGLIPIADVDEAQSRLDLKTADEIDAQNQLATRYDELAEIVDVSLDHLSLLTPKFRPSSPKPSDIKQWLQMALDRNHLLRSERLALKIQEKNEDIAFAGHLPSADLTAQYRGSDSDNALQIDTISSARGYISSRGGSIEGRVEIFGGGGTQALVEQEEFNTLAAGFNTERVTRETTSNTKQAYRNVQTSISRIDALEQAVVSGLSALEATRASYEVGTRASIDVLDRLTDLYEQKQNLSAARYTYIRNVIELKRLAGILTDKDIKTIDSWLVTKKQKEQMHDKSDVKDNVLEIIKKRDDDAFKKMKEQKNSGTSSSDDDDGDSDDGDNGSTSSSTSKTPAKQQEKATKDNTQTDNKKSSDATKKLEQKLNQLESPDSNKPKKFEKPKEAEPKSTKSEPKSEQKAEQKADKPLSSDGQKNSKNSTKHDNVAEHLLDPKKLDDLNLSSKELERLHLNEKISNEAPAVKTRDISTEESSSIQKLEDTLNKLIESNTN